jgi:hypothetical protein
MKTGKGQGVAMFRNRRQFWWFANLLGYFLFLGILISGILPISWRLGGAVSVVWTGLLAMHSVMLYYGQEPAQEKVKRQMKLSYDGELVEVTDEGEPIEAIEDDAQAEPLNSSNPVRTQTKDQTR